MPPIPGGMPPGIPPPAFSSGISETMASVVIIKPATEPAACRAVLVTFAGSKIPILIMSPYSEVATSEYGDMIKMGILDPAKVTRTALQAAGSVAGLMITTEAMVSDIPEENAGGGMPGGMPPGMGGMDGMM